MSPVAWGDIFTSPLRGDRIMELRQVFISHLTNSGECGNLQPKVSLTVSPFSPSFPPQLNLFPHSLRAVSPVFTAFTPNRALTPLSTAFTQTYRGCGVPRRKVQSAGPALSDSFPCHISKSVACKSFACTTSEKTADPSEPLMTTNNNDHEIWPSTPAQDTTRFGWRCGFEPQPCRLATARFPRAFALWFPAPGSSRRSMSQRRIVRTTKKFELAQALPPAKETSARRAG